MAVIYTILAVSKIKYDKIHVQKETLRHHLPLCVGRFLTGSRRLPSHLSWLHLCSCRIAWEPGRKLALRLEPHNTKHVATRRNIVAKRKQHVPPNNVAKCCVNMLRRFGRGFTWIDWGYFFSLLDGMLVNRRVPPPPRIKFASTPAFLPLVGERGNVPVKCLSQEHNVTTQSGLEHYENKSVSTVFWFIVFIH